METSKNLKNYRENELKSYVIGNILVMLLLSGAFESIRSNDIYDFASAFSTIANTMITSSITYIFVFIMDSMIQGKIKFKIVLFPFWEMPGMTIFTDIRNDCKDMRFTKEDAQKHYARLYEKLPDDSNKRKHYENAEWNKIYRKYENESRIFIANRDYLLCRDMTSMTLFLIGLYFVGIYVLGIFHFSWKMLIILIVEFLACKFATIGKGKRLAYNVLYMDVSSPDNKEDAEGSAGKNETE